MCRACSTWQGACGPRPHPHVCCSGGLPFCPQSRPLPRPFARRVEDRVALFVATVQVYKLLSLLRSRLAPTFVPLGVPMRASAAPGGWERTLTLFPSMELEKSIRRWSLFKAEFSGLGVSEAALAELYSRVRGKPGVVQASHGPTMAKDKYRVVLYPVGLTPAEARPTTAEELRAAAHGLLHGLNAIHQARRPAAETDRPPNPPAGSSSACTARQLQWWGRAGPPPLLPTSPPTPPPPRPRPGSSTATSAPRTSHATTTGRSSS